MVMRFFEAAGKSRGDGEGGRDMDALPVNEPGDAYEREADSVADRVMGMEASTPAAAPASRRVQRSLQRKCAQCSDQDEEDQKKRERAPGEVVQRRCSHCEEEGERSQKRVQRTETGPGPSLAPPSVHDMLRSPGQPLDPAVRGFMEPRFGRDFSGVRIHTGANADRAVREVSASAFTVGSDIAFAQGRYAPQTESGKRLLAHELAHVLQQRDSSVQGYARRKLEDPLGPLKDEPSQIGGSVDGRLGVQGRMSEPALQRGPGDDTPPPAVKKDVSGQFQFRTYARTNKSYKQASGQLGVPGQVEVHRNPSAQRAVSAGTGEDAGHLIGNRFGAPGGPENLSRQNWISNRHGTFKSLENAWEEKLKSGVKIKVTVTDITRGGDPHPFMRRVEWTEETNGVKTDHKELFANPDTPESRSRRNVPRTTQEGQTAKVFDLDEYRNRARGQDKPGRADLSSEGADPLRTESGKRVKAGTVVKAEQQPLPTKAPTLKAPTVKAETPPKVASRVPPASPLHPETPAPEVAPKTRVTPHVDVEPPASLTEHAPKAELKAEGKQRRPRRRSEGGQTVHYEEMEMGEGTALEGALGMVDDALQTANLIMDQMDRAAAMQSGKPFSREDWLIFHKDFAADVAKAIDVVKLRFPERDSIWKDVFSYPWNAAVKYPAAREWLLSEKGAAALLARDAKELEAMGDHMATLYWYMAGLERIRDEIDSYLAKLKPLRSKVDQRLTLLAGISQQLEDFLVRIKNDEIQLMILGVWEKFEDAGHDLGLLESAIVSRQQSYENLKAHASKEIHEAKVVYKIWLGSYRTPSGARALPLTDEALKEE